MALTHTKRSILKLPQDELRRLGEKLKRELSLKGAYYVQKERRSQNGRHMSPSLDGVISSLESHTAGLQNWDAKGISITDRAVKSVRFQNRSAHATGWLSHNIHHLINIHTKTLTATSSMTFSGKKVCAICRIIEMPTTARSI